MGKILKKQKSYLERKQTLKILKIKLI
jgi:hypothetical protein